MLITNKTIISFKVPEECQAAEKFKADNPDWVESETTQYIGFVKESTYAVEAKEDTECERS